MEHSSYQMLRSTSCKGLGTRILCTPSLLNPPPPLIATLYNRSIQCTGVYSFCGILLLVALVVGDLPFEATRAFQADKCSCEIRSTDRKTNGIDESVSLRRQIRASPCLRSVIQNMGLTAPRAVEPSAGPEEPRGDDPDKNDSDGDGRVVERLRVDCGVTEEAFMGQSNSPLSKSAACIKAGPSTER